MTDAAIIAIAGSSAGVTIVVAVCMFLLGRRAADAEKRAGEANVKAAKLDGAATSATISADGWRIKATDLEARNARLVASLSKAADALPADGARERVHAEWFAGDIAASPVSATVAGGLHDPAKPAAADPDGLERPGE